MYKQPNTISFLLGAGFLVSARYPIGNSVNEYVLKLHEQSIHFTPNGRLVHNYYPGYVTELDSNYPMFLATIDYYLQIDSRPLNYEEFFDFLKQEILSNKKYAEWWKIKNPHPKVTFCTKMSYTNRDK